MSIAKKVSKAFDEMQANDPLEALYQICSAIDATATAEAGRTGRTPFKEFICQNMDLITRIGFQGNKVLNINLPDSFPNPQMNRNTDGSVSLQEILYHIVRCGHFHEAEIPSTLRFIDEFRIRASDGELELPSSLIYGLIWAVVVSPTNRKQETYKEAFINVAGEYTIPLSML